MVCVALRKRRLVFRCGASDASRPSLLLLGELFTLTGALLAKDAEPDRCRLAGVMYASLADSWSLVCRAIHLESEPTPSSSVLDALGSMAPGFFSCLTRFCRWVPLVSERPAAPLLAVKGDAVGDDSPALVAVPESGEPFVCWEPGRDALERSSRACRAAKGLAASKDGAGVAVVAAIDEAAGFLSGAAFDEAEEEGVEEEAEAAAPRRQPSSSDV